MKTADIRPGVELDACVVMPNHFHGIIVVSNDRGTAIGRGTARPAPTGARFGQPVSGAITTVRR
jgi:hypothetical protein